jgi:hypothetical protein
MGYELGGLPSGRRPGIAGSLTTAVTGRDVQLLVSGQSSVQIPPGRRRPRRVSGTRADVGWSASRLQVSVPAGRTTESCDERRKSRDERRANGRRSGPIGQVIF